MNLRDLCLVTASAVFLSTGCIGARSLTTGHLASLPGAGRAEVALSPGVAYQRVHTDPTSLNSKDYTTSILALPILEGNVAYGLSESLGLNLHLSGGGIQPGLQIVLVNGPLSLAVLPEIALAYGRISSPTGSGDGSMSEYAVGFMAGAKVLASHRSGIYGSVGYDFQHAKLSSSSSSSSSGSSDSSSSASLHSVTAAAGFDVKAGSVSIRPEIAFLYTPYQAQITEGSSTKTTASSWAIMPTITLAAGTGR